MTLVRFAVYPVISLLVVIPFVVGLLWHVAKSGFKQGRELAVLLHSCLAEEEIDDYAKIVAEAEETLRRRKNK
tara:strand:+ start:2490 stop:2708 length:219 start_codon:yes stop_codon:yes gene_type:complete